MLTIKSKFIFSIISVCVITVLNSCSGEGYTEIDKNPVITLENFELLKFNALNEYNIKDFSKVTNPTPNTVNYEQIIKILNNNLHEHRSSYFDYSDYESLLGEYYDEEYFSQLSDLFEFSSEIIQSDLFNESSTIEEREDYLEEILIYVILHNSSDGNANRILNCHAHYNACSGQAERDHGIRIASCTAGAVVLGILTGGAGAATWPVCMATSGFLYESAMQACSDHLDACLS